MEAYEEIYRCTACMNEDCIVFTRDLGYCTECGTPEHYEPVELEQEDSYD